MRIPIITGPTGVGKTSISISIAESIGAEIVSCDSRQIFRQLSIGTAKPTTAERVRVKHHLIDELDLEDSYSAGIFSSMAEKCIFDIISRGLVPLVTGGSTLYLKALIFGLANIPQVDAEIRQRLNERIQTESSETLFEELAAVDPEFARTLDPTKSQRIVRGLEVHAGTGQSLSSFFSDHDPPQHEYELFVLTRNRSILYDRINHRVDQMIDNGLVEEVQSLVAAGASPAMDALQTIGYKEVFRFLNGQLERDEMIELIKRNTRRYAKRQLTWFRKYDQATWIDLDRGEEIKIIEVLLNSQRDFEHPG